MKFQYSDGGRAESGLPGCEKFTGDCAPRAIAIATGRPYREIYEGLVRINRYVFHEGRKRYACRSNSAPKDGVYPATFRAYLARIGWTWTPTMFIGSGCRVHLLKEELPEGRLIVRMSKHLTAVIDGVLYDTVDLTLPTKQHPRPRCVYGYWQLKP